jgi:anti-anti-sigma regulatory factor
MKFYLIVARGKRQGLPIPVDFDLFLIGSSPLCHLRAEHESIGEQHCALVRRDRKVFICDLDSGGSTFVNREEIPPGVELPLHAGDQLDVGPLEFIIQYHERAMPRRDLEDWAHKCLDQRGGHKIQGHGRFESVVGESSEDDAAHAASRILDHLTAHNGVVAGRMRVSCEAGITVVRLHDPFLVEEPEIRSIEKDLHANLNHPRLRVLLDMKQVKRLSSSAAQMLSSLRGWMKPAGGSLAICRLRPELKALLQSLPFTHGIPMFDHKPDAIAARW